MVVATTAAMTVYSAALDTDIDTYQGKEVVHKLNGRHYLVLVQEVQAFDDVQSN